MDLLSQIHLKEWYKAVTVGGVALTVAAITVHERDWAMLAVGIFLIGLGRWIDQKAQEGLPFWHQGAMLKPSWEGYRPSIIGVPVIVLGIVIFCRGIWRLW